MTDILKEHMDKKIQLQKDLGFSISSFSPAIPQMLVLINIEDIENELVVMVRSNQSVWSKIYRGGTLLIYLLDIQKKKC